MEVSIMFKNHLYFIIAIFIALLFTCFSCKDSTDADEDDNNTTFPTPTVLAGNWIASKVEFTNQENPSQKIDISQQGGSASITIETNGHYTFNVLISGETPSVETGTIIGVSSQVIEFRSNNGVTHSRAYTYSTTVFTLQDEYSDFDFDGDDTNESATLYIILQRSLPNVSDIVGTWNATQFEFTNAGDTTEKVDIIPLGGGLILVIGSQATYSATISLPGENPIVETGQIIAKTSTTILLLPNNDDSYSFNYSRVGNILTLINENSDFDFDDTGNEIPAILKIILAKQ